MDARKPGMAHEMLKARLNRLMSKPAQPRPAVVPRVQIIPAPVYEPVYEAAPDIEPIAEPEPEAQLDTYDVTPELEPAEEIATVAIVAPKEGPPPPLPEAAPASADNRLAPRKRSNLPALILMPGSTTGTPCLVLDMSATGARLKVPAGAGYCHPNNMPSHISLFLKSDWLQVECEVVRRDDHEMGVRFCSAMKQVQKPPARPQIKSGTKSSLR